MDCPTETQDDVELVRDIDAGIRDVVMLLRANGLKTIASCSGEDGHGFSSPMVRMDADDLPAARRKVFEILNANHYQGYYVKEWYSNYGSTFLEVEFWGQDCLIPAAPSHTQEEE